jgi:hypothetical protein
MASGGVHATVLGKKLGGGPQGLGNITYLVLTIGLRELGAITCLLLTVLI